MNERRIEVRICLALFAAMVLLAGPAFSAESKGWEANPEKVKSLSKSRPGIIYDEADVPEYTLPDPLVMQNGEKIGSASAWRNKRREEVLELFQAHVYGKAPKAPAGVVATVFDNSDNALDGKATRKQATISVMGPNDTVSMDILMYLPNQVDRPVPTFLILNFGGNHTICSDPAIRLSTRWQRQTGEGVVKNLANEESRGRAASRFPLEKILDRGYGLATIYYGDIDPDFDDGFKNGFHAAFDNFEGERPPDVWGSIAAWAWGLSRAMDYLETDRDVDTNRVIVMGHSRLGKTSLWAGASDERFAMVVSNDSGCGGAALSRRRYGESVKRINTSFPHWFCGNFKKYNDNEAELPVDQHMLIALIAPRPVYVASADEDLWADPRGEFLSAKNAGPVYSLLDVKGLGVDAMPPLDQPVQNGRIAYHVRTGGHDVKEFDWEQYMNFADKNVKKK